VVDAASGVEPGFLGDEHNTAAARAFWPPTGKAKPTELAIQLKAALTGAQGIRLNEICFVATDSRLKDASVAAQLAAARELTLAENAHLFALLNVTMADAAIACWDGKYRYVFWRPITAIREGIIPADSDPAWIPWLDFFPGGTPAHPEYPSGHSTVSGSAAFILAAAFGENTAFSIDSETLPGKIRSFASFTDTTTEIANARVFGGIHYRTSCVRGNMLGRTVADYVLRHALRAAGDDERDNEN